jgi:peptide/nickel transport system substrate-binding protein
MHSKGGLRAVAGVSALLLLMAGCGSTQQPPTAPDPGKNLKDGGELRVYIGEPRHIVSTNSGESEGGAVIRAMYSGLIDYVGNDYKIVNIMADSITSTDNKAWTIKMKSGWTFHNGEPVNADAYIRAWNAGAYEPNAQVGSHFFERIEGYADLQGKAPKAKEMSGLKKVDDNTFQVTLSKPFAGFPVALGYPVFMPMAKACADDLKACDEAPIGNGPFKIDGKWEHKQQIKLVRYADFKGTKPHLDKLTFKIYDKIDTAYNDLLAGNIDLMPRTLPPSKVPEARTKFGSRLIEQPAPNLTYIATPVYQDAYKNKKLRQAISMSIERQPIIDAVFQGRFTPAKSFSPPNFPGGRDNTCKYCDFNADKAKQALAEAGGWPAGKKLELWFNAGAGHEVWMQAAGDQIKKTLGIDYELKGQLQFAQYLETADAKKMTGPFRQGWLPDYPLSENYLTPMYGTGASSNYSGYSNPEFDAKIAAGDGAKSLDEATKLYGEAEAILGEDLPGIPLWFSKTSIAFGETVDNVSYNGVQGINYTAIGFKK